MSEKNIKKSKKKKSRSLSQRTFRTTVRASIIFGLITLVLGLALYSYAVGGQYINTAFSLAYGTSAVLDKVVDVGPFADDVMSRYNSLSQEERDMARDPEHIKEYKEKFEDLIERDDFKQIVGVMHDMLKTGDAYDLYIATYDVANKTMIYIATIDDVETTNYFPGYWEEAEVDQSELDAYKNWDGEEKISNIFYTRETGWICVSGVPIDIDENNNIVTCVMTEISLVDVARRMRLFILLYSIAMFVIVNVLAIFLVWRMRKNIVTPINAISEAAENYIADKRNRKKDTDHFSSLNIKTGDELEHLSLMMANMEKELGDYEKSLTTVTAEKERIGAELSLANRIQAAMLPSIYPAFPDRKEFDVYATMTPAKEVGGDFYDFYLIDDTHLGIVIADVSGKGVPAALFMMVSKILVNNAAMTGKGPAEVLYTVNNQICANNREEMFVTMWFGILDIKSGKLTAANAGHEFPILKKPDGEYEVIKDKHGLVIGGMAGVKYNEYELQLEHGSELYIYTDGVAEAANASGELFGINRTVESLNNTTERNVRAILKAVNDDIKKFVDGAPQFDDITMLCLQYFGESEGAHEQQKKYSEITVDATVKNLATVTKFVKKRLAAMDCPPKAMNQIDVAIDELFGNIVHYAYKGVGKATVTIEKQESPLGVVITFTDSGKPYNPLEHEAPDVKSSLEEREVGGLGIFIVKKTMDEINYERKDGKNVLTIKKNF